MQNQHLMRNVFIEVAGRENAMYPITLQNEDIGFVANREHGIVWTLAYLEQADPRIIAYPTSLIGMEFGEQLRGGSVDDYVRSLFLEEVQDQSEDSLVMSLSRAGRATIPESEAGIGSYFREAFARRVQNGAPSTSTAFAPSLVEALNNYANELSTN